MSPQVPEPAAPASPRWHQTERVPHFTRTQYVKPSPDGRRHPEVQLHTVTLIRDEDGRPCTHATDRRRTFDTLCGVPWFARLSASGFHRIAAVDCAACRAQLDPR